MTDPIPPQGLDISEVTQGQTIDAGTDAWLFAINAFHAEYGTLPWAVMPPEAWTVAWTPWGVPCVGLTGRGVDWLRTTNQTPANLAWLDQAKARIDEINATITEGNVQ